MKKKILPLALLLSMLVSILAFTIHANASDDGNTVIKGGDIPLKLWYDEEAIKSGENSPTVSTKDGSGADVGWERWSLPIGNGYFGANVFGRTETERIQISEKTMHDRPLTESGKSIGGLNSFSETYIDFGHTNASVTNYTRYLDINNAISGVEYTYNGVTYTREYFASYPDNALVIRLDADSEGALSFTLRPTVPYKKSYGIKPNDGYGKTGTVTSTVKDGIGEIELSGKMNWFDIDFLGIFKVYTNGGTVSASVAENSYTDSDGSTKVDTNGTIVVNGATSAYIVVTLGTDYELNEDIFYAGDHINNRDQKPTYKTDLSYTKDKVSAYMTAIDTKISDKSYDDAYKTLKDAHIADYKSLFDRVSLDLGCKASDYSITTDKLLKNYKNGVSSSYLETLMFQYGRYLLIASSRPGTMPAHLQGAWNTYDVPPWACGYWHNINVQMNYWPAFSTNLEETFEAYKAYNSAYMKQAEKYADEVIKQYNPEVYDKDGGNGWTIGYDGYQFRITSDRSPGNLGLTTQLFWDYYDYTRDPAVLNYVYDILANAARFITKCVKLNENGNYVVEYCDSPEMYVNGVWYYTEGTTYAQTFAYVNNYNALEAAKALGINLNDEQLLTSEEYSILNTIIDQIDKYDPIKVGLSGQIKEFPDEDYYGSIGDEYQHRHTSQLVGLYPGNLINQTTPAWLDASKVTLNERGDLGTGWSIAYKLNMWARIGDGNRSYELLSNIIKTDTSENLWTTHPPFQIDANFGTTAGISEMLLQSQEGYISPLAAIPDNWQNGSYAGLVARGNFEVSAAWENGLAKTFNIKSNNGGTASVYYPSITNAYVVDSDGNKVNYTVSGTDLISFETEIGKTYIIYGFKEVKIPDAPKNLDFVKNINGSYDLVWSAVNSARSYNVYVAIDSSPVYELVGSTTDTSFSYVPTVENRNSRTTFAVTAISEGESERALAYNNSEFITEYGAIPKEHVGYPYSIFVKGPSDQKYVFVESHIKFIDAANAAADLIKVNSGTYKGGTVVIYMTNDSKAVGSAFNNGSYLDGTLIVDLGGNQLTVGVPRLIGFEAKKVNETISNVSKVVVKNGSVVTNGTPVAEVWCGGTSGSFNYTGTKKFEILFDNVYFTKGLLKADSWSEGVSVLKSRGSFTSSKQAALKAEFRDCTFDYKNEAKSLSIIDCSAGGHYAKCDITVAGGKVISTAYVRLFNGSMNDTITYTVGSDGNETEFETTGGGMVTKYGVIPSSALTSDKKFAAFGKKPGAANFEYIGVWGGIHSGALNNVRDKIKHDSGAYAGGEVVILLLCDYEYTSNDGGNSSAWNRGFMIDGTMTLDLGGHTITISKARFIGFETGSNDIIGNVADYKTTFKFTNGTILSNNPIAEVFAGSSAYTGNKQCVIEFENITFRSKGSTSLSLLKARGDFKNGQNVDLTININNCVFDYPAATTLKLFEDASTIGEVKSTINVIGSTFKVANNALQFFISSDSIDSFAFGKNADGNYTSIEMPTGSSAPAGTFNGGNLVFVKVSEGATKTVYTLRNKALAELSYTPKMSITLARSVQFNVYLPIKDLLKFNFDGVSYENLAEISTKTIDGVTYYALSVSLPSSVAMRDIPLSVTIQLGSDTVTGKFTFSLQKYATKVFDAGSIVEKQVVRDTLSYIRAAYYYFNPGNTQAIAKIDTLIGKNYDVTSPITAKGDTTSSTDGLIGASIKLSATPAIRFYISADANAADYRFYRIENGKEVTFGAKEGTDDLGRYLEMDIYAYAMCQTIYYKTSAGACGNYHIASYYEWAKSQNNDKLVTLVERLWKYAESAWNYRNAVTVTVNYVDESGNTLAASETVTKAPGAEVSFTSPAVSGYYTRQLYVYSSASENSTINVVYKQIPTGIDHNVAKELLPDISAWGDSITEGSNSGNLTAAREHGIDLEALGSTASGGNYVQILKNLIATKVYSGINVYNLGVGSETTATIAARANTENYYFYINEAVTLTNSPIVLALQQNKDLNLDGRLGVLRRTDNLGLIKNVTMTGKDENGNDVTVSGLLSCVAAEGQNIVNCNYEYLTYTFTRTDGKTNKVFFDQYTRIVTNSAVLLDGNICIIFMGENGGYNKDNATIIAQQEEILKACGNPEFFLIISSTSKTTAERKSLNDALSARWGDNYINMGNVLNSSRSSYDFVGYSEEAIVKVLDNIIEGSVTKLLLADGCHPNAVGYTVIANTMFERLSRLGAFDAIFDYYDSLGQ